MQALAEKLVLERLLNSWVLTYISPLSFLRRLYPTLEFLASICTGAGLLAAAGLLSGKRATSNKVVLRLVCLPRSPCHMGCRGTVG